MLIYIDQGGIVVEREAKEGKDRVEQYGGDS